MKLLAPMEKFPTSIKELFLLSKFDKSSSSVRDLSKSCDYEVMASLPLEAEYPMEPFQ